MKTTAVILTFPAAAGLCMCLCDVTTILHSNSNLKQFLIQIQTNSTTAFRAHRQMLCLSGWFDQYIGISAVAMLSKQCYIKEADGWPNNNMEYQKLSICGP